MRLIIADKHPDNISKFCKCILWNDFYTGEQKVVSIPKIIDSDPMRCRQIILDWLSDLPNRRVYGSYLRDYLKPLDGFDYWSFSQLGQQFNAADRSAINQLVKIFLLESELIRDPPDLISIDTEDDSLRHIVEEFCTRSKVTFIAKTKNRNKFLYFIQSFSLSVIPSIKAAGFFLLRLLPRLIKNSKKIQDFRDKDFDFAVFDVLIHLTDPRLNVFRSNYWAELINVFDDAHSRVTWHHLYHKHRDIQSLREADLLLKTFSASDTNASHSLLESSLNFATAMRGLRDFLVISAKSYLFRAPTDAFWSPSEMFNVWPNLREAWYDSTRGPNGLLNCVWRHQFDEIISKINVKQAGLYLMENQPWEMALVAAWRKHQSVKLIGVPHSTIRFWDLRYFHGCKQELTLISSCQPDFMAVNGLSALTMMRESGYPEERLVMVEALRYLDLSRFNLMPTAARSEAPLKILVCGDFSSVMSERLCNCLYEALTDSQRKFRVYFRPHPSQNYIPPKDFQFSLTEPYHTMAECLESSDIVLVSHISSTAVEAAYANRYVISLLDVTLPNMSPFFRSDVIKFAYDSWDLAAALADYSPPTQLYADDYFCTNSELPRWRALLELPPIGGEEVKID